MRKTLTTNSAPATIPHSLAMLRDPLVHLLSYELLSSQRGMSADVHQRQGDLHGKDSPEQDHSLFASPHVPSGDKGHVQGQDEPRNSEDGRKPAEVSDVAHEPHSLLRPLIPFFSFLVSLLFVAVRIMDVGPQDVTVVDQPEGAPQQKMTEKGCR